jgi:hypothetical protein
MIRFAYSMALLAGTFPLGLLAQTNEAGIQVAVPGCLPSRTLDELTNALDEAVSGPGNKDRTCLRQILLPEARLTPMRKAEDGSFAPHILTVDDWIDAVAKRGSAAFYERQVKVTAEQYGHFAHLWSTYEIRATPDGKETTTGINSIQAVFDGTRWRIFSVLWEPDTTAGPVPKRYSP